MSRLKKMVCSVGAIIAIVTGGAVVSTDGYPPPVGAVVIDGEHIGDLKISKRALEVIGNAEGCRRNPYQCPAGLLTDGIGNTHGVTGQVKTDNQIAADWVRNILAAQACLAKETALNSLRQGEIDSLVSFIFNTGCTTYRRNKDGSSTRIAKYVRAGDMTAACNEFQFWVYAAGKRLAGLVTRRHLEFEMCIGKV
ncbi:lysozyme [Vibrio coralliilyticus]|uniref:lysozyme n=1 Tax=Vibrio TaxID=662 RepID=UPI00148B9D68|nr:MULTISPECIES: lysozyme [Vibrio]NOH26190.1 lysozyme [Vibrio europaeus]NOH41649.1 lysozyme [Vibrio coralliilyticus]